MARGKMKKYLSIVLAAIMLLAMLPVGVYAEGDSTIGDAQSNQEEQPLPDQGEVEIGLGEPGQGDGTPEPEAPIAPEAEGETEPEPEGNPANPDGQEQQTNAPAVTEVADYETFLACFKELEGYAQAYAAGNAGEDANALIINFIRTGVERYTSGTWEMVCGKENTAFTAYVAEQDAANSTSASALKNLKNFNLPNGNYADMGHVFGAMDVANYAKVQGMTAQVVQARADMGSWAGDISDLMFCAENVDIPDKVNTSETDV